MAQFASDFLRGSIHPQGWVPIETGVVGGILCEAPRSSSIHPQGWVPIETANWSVSAGMFSPYLRSIHPQGWVPIETLQTGLLQRRRVCSRSIHPQGWVPIETRYSPAAPARTSPAVAFTPKGGCPLKPITARSHLSARLAVAFTPKGGCVADEWLWRCTAQAQCV